MYQNTNVQIMGMASGQVPAFAPGGPGAPLPVPGSSHPPGSVANAYPNGLPCVQNEGAAKEFLSRCQWPESLQESFIQSVSKIPLRFFICDDSGSMETGDGKRVVPDGKGSNL
jgi:hypothetical protein